MPINFLDTTCQQITSEQLFGICDAPPPPYVPAYLSFDAINKPGWIAEIINNNAIPVLFTAIDNCISIPRPNGKEDNKCDCMLLYADTILFIELKDRHVSGWLGIARDQLIKTINHFKNNHDVSIYANKRANIANAQRPTFTTNYHTTMEKIKDETDGFICDVKCKIEIP